MKRWGYSGLPLRQWYEKVSDVENELFFDMKGVHGKRGRGSRQKHENILERARIFVEFLSRQENLHIKKIVLLDGHGHGRMLFSIIREILSVCPDRLSGLDFIVCDTDKDVHLWHLNFFPKDVKCLLSDICEMDSVCFILTFVAWVEQLA